MARRSIDIDSFAHQNPIPAASRVGPLLASSIIGAVNPGTREVPDDPEAQVENLFHHVGQMLAVAGGDWRHVAKMTFFVTDLKLRATINGPWLKRFPDAESRPARHTQLSAEASERPRVSCDFLAYIED